MNPLTITVELHDQYNQPTNTIVLDMPHEMLFPIPNPYDKIIYRNQIWLVTKVRPEENTIRIGLKLSEEGE